MTKLKIERVSNGYVVDNGREKKVSENLDDIFENIKSQFKNSFSNQRPVYEFEYEIIQVKSN